MIDPLNDATHIVAAIERGDTKAADRLLLLVYDELRILAAHWLRREADGHSLQPTALVHEAYLRLVGGDPSRPWEGRGHFFAAAAEAMRRILVEHARRNKSQKRGGARRRVEFADPIDEAAVKPDELLALDEALSRLAETDPERAELVKLRFFGGMTIPEAAGVLGISKATAERSWAYARAWLHREISRD